MNLHFVVPGFSKCGTTTLCSLLGEHPQIFIPDAKEPCFFAYNYGKGWEWYAKSFAKARPDQICGEGSTFYSTEEYADVVCRRILDRFPDIRFIFIARHPIARIESSFREMHHSGWKYGVEADYSIGDALRSLPNMAADTMYWSRVETFRRYVPDDRIHVLFLEDLKQDAAAELERCFRFLRVDPKFELSENSRRLNPASEKLYDSPLYRSIRSRRWSHLAWRCMPAPAQSLLIRTLRLRRPFRGAIPWDPQAKRSLIDRLRQDSRSFLRWAGKPDDFWRLDALSDDLHRAA